MTEDKSFQAGAVSAALSPEVGAGAGAEYATGAAGRAGSEGEAPLRFGHVATRRPKRSAFFNFMASARTRLPGLSQREVAQRAPALWRGLSAAERQPYVDMAAYARSVARARETAELRGREDPAMNSATSALEAALEAALAKARRAEEAAAKAAMAKAVGSRLQRSETNVTAAG